MKVVYVRIILFRRESQSTDNVFIYKYLFLIIHCTIYYKNNLSKITFFKKKW